jgi:hypothetical protein
LHSWSRLLPFDAEVVTAFEDLDEDGRLDVYAEPSTPCRHDDGPWSCRVHDKQITVLRLERDDRKDTFVLPRQPSPAMFCVGDPEGCRGDRVEQPTSDEMAQALSACTDDNLTLWIDDAAARHSVLVGARPALELDVHLREMPDGASVVEISGPDVSDADRMLVWIGPEAAPLWSSEDGAAAWQDFDGKSTVVVPSAIRAACSDCPVDVAIATHDRRRHEATSTEILDVREKRAVLTREPL